MNTNASDQVIAAMPLSCRVAFAAYESGYIGGLSGGRHTAAKAFAAGWAARKQAELLVAAGLGRGIQAGTPPHKAAVARSRPLRDR